MEGFINLNKPAGPTSHDMIDLVRRLSHQRRVGHGGTLDPLAQGVLPIGLGRATRLLAYFQEWDKVYRAHVLLGVSTSTYDVEGTVTAERPVPALGRAELERILADFQGQIEQVPPPYSAIRQGGRRLYQRVRAGEKVVPPPRQVDILDLQILSWQPPRLTLQIACGSGTYIRSLAHDVGERLGCGAHLAGLVRLRVGPMRLDDALAPEELRSAAARGRLDQVLLPLDLAVRHWPAVEVTADQATRLVHGLPLRRSQGLVPAGQERIRAHGPDGRLLALLRWQADRQVWHPFRVFAPVERGERLD